MACENNCFEYGCTCAIIFSTTSNQLNINFYFEQEEQRVIIKKNVNDVQASHQNIHEKFEYHKKDLLGYDEAKLIKFSHYSIPPGKSNYPYHYHTQNEEVFYILSGNGIVKTPKGDISISEGDVIYFPSDETGAHKLTNTSDSEMLVYLDVDTKIRPDVCIYPETNKIGIYGDKIRQIHKMDKGIDYYEGE